MQRTQGLHRADHGRGRAREIGKVSAVGIGVDGIIVNDQEGGHAIDEMRKVSLLLAMYRIRHASRRLVETKVDLRFGFGVGFEFGGREGCGGDDDGFEGLLGFLLFDREGSCPWDAFDGLGFWGFPARFGAWRRGLRVVCRPVDLEGHPTLSSIALQSQSGTVIAGWGRLVTADMTATTG